MSCAMHITDMSIKLETSLGEAIDKLTILDIKKDKINDGRKKDVETEFDYMMSELKPHVERHWYYYKILKKTNLEIWELQDTLRSNQCVKESYYRICDEILNLNDSRYLVKKKINEVCKSNMKEQKGYGLRALNVILTCGIDIINILNGAIRYYSFFYDEINLFSTSETIDHLSQMFNDDPFIKLHLNNALNDSNYGKVDTVEITDNEVVAKLTHSFFNNKCVNAPNDNHAYSKQVNDIYNKLGMSATICDEYRN